MPRYELKNFAKADEIRDFPHGRLELLSFGNDEFYVIGRLNVQPGWRWSADVGPSAGTDLCQLAHFAYCVSGVMGFSLPDGTEFIMQAGDAAAIHAGHDAWVIGQDPVIMLDYGEGIADYAA
jgi:hypothetical protein